MTTLLIVNADDYGLTSGVSQGIRRAFLEGILTSTTAMMNQPSVHIELPKALKQCFGLGLGVHLTLTAGAPLLPAEKIPTLVNANGAFYAREAFIKRLAQIDPDEALAEWRAQVDKFIQITGRKPDHLDSHHHSSYFTPALFERMLALAAEFGCAIRNPYGADVASARQYLPGGQPEADFAAVQALLAKFKPHSTQGFCGDFYADTATLPYLQQLLERISASPLTTWELMCHPAVVDDRLRKISSYNEARAQELQVLTDPGLDGFLAPLKIELAHFGKG